MKKIILQLLKRETLIYYGIVLGIYCFLFNLMINTLGGTNMFLNVILIIGFIFGLLLSAILTGVATYYYLKKSKDTTILILAIISAIVTVLSLFGIQFISALMSLGSGNYFSVLVNYGTLARGLGAYSWAFYIAYLGAIYCLVLFLEMKDVLNLPKLRELYENKEVIAESEKIDVQSVSENHTEQTAEESQPVQEQFVLQPIENKGPKKKKGFIVGIVITCIVLLCGSGYLVYNAFFSSTRVNLVKSAELVLTGYDGEGYAKIMAKTDYEDNDKDVLDFLNGVYYTIENNDVKNGKLTNGEKVKVIANYSKSLAKVYNIDITNDTYEVEVKGLVVRYTDGTKIPVDLLKKMQNDATQKAQLSLLSNSTTKQSVEFDSAYFISSSSYSNRLIMVYKLTTEKSGVDSETVTKYVAYYCSNPKSNYGSEDVYWYSRSLYDNSYKYISKKEDVKASLQKSFNSTTGSELQELTIAQ